MNGHRSSCAAGVSRRKAAFNAGLIYLDDGDFEAAEAAFRWSLAGTDKGLCLKSAIRLAHLLINQQRSDEARGQESFKASSGMSA